nr:heat shock protein HslJ [uncultured Enterobacter sp.]
MKKHLALTALALLLAGCANDGKVSVTDDQLVHHRFVLESVNGKAVNAGENPPEIRFGEKLQLSGVMCNRFTGQGKLSDGALSAKNLAMTRMMCADPQRNELDQAFSVMMNKGAQADLTETQLTLATAEQTLIFKLADNAQ